MKKSPQVYTYISMFRFLRTGGPHVYMHKNTNVCYICIEPNETTYTSPCDCNASVHEACLNEYLKQRTHNKCSICKTAYRIPLPDITLPEPTLAPQSRPWKPLHVMITMVSSFYSIFFCVCYFYVSKKDMATLALISFVIYIPWCIFVLWPSLVRYHQTSTLASVGVATTE